MKIGFLITARLKSTRLPLKLLKSLDGKTVVEQVIERAKRVKGLSDVVLCTSINPQDRPLVDIALDNGIYYFLGSEEDVLQRLLEAARFFDLDYLVSITADNPLLTIHYSNIIVDEARKGRYDFIKLEGLPLGVATHIMRVNALETICRIKATTNTEIWGYFAYRPELFDVKTVQVQDALNRPDLRLTLDYAEDYELINNIYSNISFRGVLNLYDVINYINANPDVAKINDKCTQIELSEEVKTEIDRIYNKDMKKIKAIKREIYSTH